MKKVNNILNQNNSNVKIDKSLDTFRDIVLFQEKLALANTMLASAKLPNKRNQK